MADLSNVEARKTQQDRITRNRDQMFSRRNLEAPAARNMSDLRNATRGTAAADELRRTLGMINNATSDFKDYADKRFEKKEDENSAQGAADAITGNPDEERLAKSRAYRESYTFSRTQREWAEQMPGLEKDLQKLLAEQTDPDPEARKAQVAELIEQRFLQFALDEEGEMRDFGSPGATRWMAEQMNALRGTTLANASSLIEKQMQKDSLEDMGTTIRSRIIAGQDVDWAEVSRGVLPGVTDEVKTEEMISAVKTTVAELAETDPVRALRVMDGFLGFARQQQMAIETIDPNTEAATAPTALVTPFKGFDPGKISSKMGEARGNGSHNGEDFPVPVGTPIVAPMGGEVIGSYRNQRGGHQVRIRMDDGTIMGVAHLSTRQVKEGDRVEAGQQIALSGNTGKSSGPHVHMTIERDGKKVSPSAWFSAGPTADPRVPAADPSVLNPPKPSELAEAQGPALTAPQAGFTPTNDQRLQLLEFRRTIRDRVDRAEEEERTELWTTNQESFLLRMAGVGAPLTITEIREAGRTGRISPSATNSLVTAIQTDERQARAESERLLRETEDNTDEIRKERVATTSDRILADVYMGRYGITGAQQRLLEVAANEQDPEVRAAILSTVTPELSKISELRRSSPEYRSAEREFNEWRQLYVAQKRNVQVPRGVKLEDAVDELMAPFIAKLASGDVRPEHVEEFLKKSEASLDKFFNVRFPPKERRSRD